MMMDRPSINQMAKAALSRAGAPGARGGSMILHCGKTGAHWPCRNQAHGDAMAATRGLKDYTITAAGKAPATIRETIEAQLARRGARDRRVA